MFGWEFPPHNSGGLGVACHGLARALVARGVELEFVLPRRFPVQAIGATYRFATEQSGIPGDIAAKLQSGYLTTQELARLRKQYPDLHIGHNVYDEVLTYAGLSRTIALEGTFDVIHAHDWLTIPAALEAKRLSGKPLVLQIHATEYDRTGMHGGDERVHAIERRGVLEADKVIAVSEYLKDIIVSMYGADPNKIEVVHNGIDHNDECVVDERVENIHRFKHDGWKVVTYLGRLTIQKGVDYLLEAAQRVLQQNEKTVFVVIGSGDMERQLVDRAAYLGISDRVLFTGFLRGSVLGRVLKMSDVFVMPSVSEPFGIVALEAALAGVPVIVSKQSGAREVLRSSLQTDFWDVNKMADQIHGLLSNESLRQTLREGALREARSHVWGRSAEKCTTIYHKLVSVPVSP